MAMKRIGIAFTRARGARRDEYGIYEGEHGGRYSRYEGYREDTPTGEKQVGLSLAGPYSYSSQSYLDFKPEHFETIRIFDEKKSGNMAHSHDVFVVTRGRRRVGIEIAFSADEAIERVSRKKNIPEPLLHARRVR